MIFKSCSVGSKVYREIPSNEIDRQDSKVNNVSQENLNRQNYTGNDDQLYWEDECKKGSKLYEFFQHMTVCHSITVDNESKKKTKVLSESQEELKDTKTEQPIYQCQSPDELALVQAAFQVGISLVETRASTYFVEEGVNNINKYIIHAEFKFDSDRKRMSTVVEDENKKYFLYTKGADSSMKDSIEWESNDFYKVVEDHLYKFAIEGLRTLMMGKRELSSKEFKDIIDGIHDIQESEERNKGPLYTKLYCEYEKNLKYVGASAIEDKLQDKVPETIEKLMEANIRVWVLTGDKQETAVEIAKSCRLIQEHMQQIELTIKMKEKKKDPAETDEQYKTRIEKEQMEYRKELLNTIADSKKEFVDAFVGYKEEKDIFNQPLKNLKKKGQQITIVIDGPTLALILGDEEVERKFLTIGLYSKSVVCCRVSPKQKSQVVALVNKYKPGCIRLSIGDGANDVPMIMEANIGVGVRGKEGTQAVRSADYAISQFKYLQKLVLYHGRLGYRRVSWVVCYYFYKNIVLVFTEIYFAFFNGLSGQIYFADWLPMLYNSLWTSLTCLFAYALERDVEYNVTVNNPQLYEAGQQKKYFSFAIFWKWVILSIFHGIVTFFGCSYGFSGVIDNEGKTEDMWFASTIAFSCIIHLVTLKLAIELNFLNWIALVAGIGSVFFYWSFVLVLNTSVFSQWFQPEIEWVYFRILSNFKA
jgi:phospholipid-translocating P-type ATPase (flippase)